MWKVGDTPRQTIVVRRACRLVLKRFAKGCWLRRFSTISGRDQHLDRYVFMALLCPLTSRCVVALVVLSTAGGLAAASETGRATPPAVAAERHEVVIADDGCTPDRLSVAEGTRTFVITNHRSTVAKWKILRGAHTIAGSDAIAPGTSEPISATLEEGRYRILCGLPTDPKGRLVVTEFVPAGTLDPQALAPVVNTYAAYVNQELNGLQGTVQALVAAAQAGDLPRARQLYGTARVQEEHIEPVVELFKDIDRAMNARASDFVDGESHPDFSGLHRIEYLLFVRNDPHGAAAYAQRLLGTVTDLRGFFNDVGITPRQIVDGASNLVENAMQSNLSGEDDIYSHADLAILQARVEGASQIIDLLRTRLAMDAPQLLASIDGRFSEIHALLAPYRREGGFAAYGALSRQDLNGLKGAMTALAEDLGQLRAVLKLG